MTEKETEAAFVRFLLARGWDLTTNNADHTDVIARRGAELLIAEVKGHTSEPGLDTDTLYGQLLRRMAPEVPDTRYAVVVPDSLEQKVLRVAKHVRDKLAIEVYLVDEGGAVRGPA